MPGFFNMMINAAGSVVKKPAGMVSTLMDRLEQIVESARSRSLVGSLLVLVFMLGLISVEINIRGILPTSLSRHVPLKHLVIISQTFTILLCFEVISLVFTFIHSVSISMGKQIEIVSLVLLRDVFKDLSYFPEPIEWMQVKPFLFPMASSALGAFLLFLILGFYYRIHRTHTLTTDSWETESFIRVKKNISFLLLLSFIIIMIYEFMLYMETGRANKTFETFYTVLIFSDILTILVSMRYTSSYIVTFRNSGFAVATVFMRLALMSPPPYNALLSIGGAMFVLGLSMHYNYCLREDYCELSL